MFPVRLVLACFDICASVGGGQAEADLSEDLSHWKPRGRPQRTVLHGRTVTLEPLDPGRHGAELFEASSVPDAGRRFLWLAETPPVDLPSFRPWLERAAASEDPLYFAVIDKASGKVAGRQTLMRIDNTHGVAEIGNIYWGPPIAGRTAATEAQYLFMRHVFDTLGFRRYEWKCNDRNAPSKRAAERFGFRFEGLFRQHMIVKGENRDTAWYSVIDKEWPALRRAYEAWLDPANFDAAGRQKRRLEEFRAEAGAA
jgi:RimJ/RimL family protein N-acetyltransferase